MINSLQFNIQDKDIKVINFSEGIELEKELIGMYNKSN